MTPEKVREALHACLVICRNNGAKPVRVHPIMRAKFQDHCSHAMWMCEEALTFPDTKIEKMMRWLGFIQGVLWCTGLSSVRELKVMNIPVGEEERPL